MWKKCKLFHVIWILELLELFYLLSLNAIVMLKVWHLMSTDISLQKVTFLLFSYDCRNRKVSACLSMFDDSLSALRLAFCPFERKCLRNAWNFLSVYYSENGCESLCSAKHSKCGRHKRWSLHSPSSHHPGYPASFLPWWQRPNFVQPLTFQYNQSQEEISDLSL